MKRKWIKWLFGSCGVVLLLIAIFLSIFLIDAPSEVKYELFRSQDVVTLVGEYKGYACGDLTPQIIPVKGIPASINKDRLGLGFVFYVPSNVVAPDQIDNIRVPGNLFEITGYYYYIEDEIKYLHPRFDLIAWHPVVPFKKWADNGELETIHEAGSNVVYSDTTVEQMVKFKVAGKYIMGCD